MSNNISWKQELRKNLTYIVALSWVAFQCYIAIYAGIPTNVQRAVHVAFACSLVFLTKPLSKDDSNSGFCSDMLCFTLCLITAEFFLLNGQRYLSRIAYISPVFTEDLVFGIVTILLVIECCRRSLGMAMNLVALFFIAYAFLGKYLPGIFNMISGSATANVATVGMLTYPPMEKAGFKPIFAASMLSIAGTAGQLIPPIMGAALFLMANFLGVNYFKIVACAIIRCFMSCHAISSFTMKPRSAIFLLLILMKKELNETRLTKESCDFKARYFVPLHEMDMCTHATIDLTLQCSLRGSSPSVQVTMKTLQWES